MTYLAVVGILLIFVLAVVVGIVDARTSTHWRQVAAERRRAWESAHLRDDNPTGRTRWQPAAELSSSWRARPLELLRRRSDALDGVLHYQRM